MMIHESSILAWNTLKGLGNLDSFAQFVNVYQVTYSGRSLSVHPPPSTHTLTVTSVSSHFTVQNHSTPTKAAVEEQPQNVSAVHVSANTLFRFDITLPNH